MSLSIDAKEFVPNFENEKKKSPLKVSLSVDVPEFIPKNQNIEKDQDSKALNNNIKVKKKLSKSVSKNSKSTDESKSIGNGTTKNFNPRDVNWANTTSFENLSGDYSVRHDKNWFNCVPSKSKLKENLKRSDSCNVSNSRKENHHQKEKLLQTYSIGVSEQAQRKLQRTEKKVCSYSYII